MTGHWQKRILLYVAEQGGALRSEIANHFAAPPHYRKWSATLESVHGMTWSGLLAEAPEDADRMISHRHLFVTDAGRDVIAKVLGE